jgi:hypothetical protein
MSGPVLDFEIKCVQPSEILVEALEKHLDLISSWVEDDMFCYGFEPYNVRDSLDQQCQDILRLIESFEGVTKTLWEATPVRKFCVMDLPDEDLKHLTVLRELQQNRIGFYLTEYKGGKCHETYVLQRLMSLDEDCQALGISMMEGYTTQPKPNQVMGINLGNQVYWPKNHMQAQETYQNLLMAGTNLTVVEFFVDLFEEELVTWTS